MTAAIALFVFGAVTAALSLQLPLGTPRMPGTGLFPLVLGVMLMGLAATQAVRLYLARPKPAQPATGAAAAPLPKRDGATQRVVLFMGAVVVATALLPTLGYPLTSFLLMLALLRVLGVRKPHVAGAIALGSAIACYVVFVKWLMIPLPSGWLGF
ncbi:MAG TPA: tripartite tricarboxylate transporter TctB family protein [Burkholderiales bacterium]|nr:tripartite tricarboxylate transporter TctB family protein [Burkholderiales bacterium]